MFAHVSGYRPGFRYFEEYARIADFRLQPKTTVLVSSITPEIRDWAPRKASFEELELNGTDVGNTFYLYTQSVVWIQTAQCDRC